MDTIVDTHKLIYCAVDRWHSVLNIDTENEIALLSLSENYIYLGNYKKANICIRRLTKLKKIKYIVKFNLLLSKYYERQGDYLRSIKYLKIITADCLSNDKLHLKLAAQYLALDNIYESFSTIDKVAKDSEYYELSIISRARCYIHIKEYENAIDLLKNSIHDAEVRNTSNVLLSKCYLAIGDFQKARYVIEQLRLSKNTSYEYLNGILSFNQFKYTEALNSFSLSVSKYNHSESILWLIKTQNIVGKKSDVLNTIASVEQVMKDDFILQGKCWEAAGFTKVAKKRFIKSVRRNSDYKSYLALTNFYFNNKNYGKALYTIKLANKFGFKSTIFENYEAKINAGIILTDNNVPSNIIELSNFDFYINDHIYKSIVNKYIEKYNQKVSSNCGETPAIGRIALFINSLGPGGAERQVVNLANGLVLNSKVKNVTLFCTHLDRREQDRFYENKVNKEVLVEEYYKKDQYIDPSSIKELSDYVSLIEHIQPRSRQQVILHMAKSLIAYSPDVVHSWLDETFINTALVCGMLGITNVVSRWGSMPPGVNREITQKDKTKVVYQHKAYAEIGRMSGIKYCTNSNLTGIAYSKLINESKNSISTVYNGIDAVSLQPNKIEVGRIRKKLGLRNSDKVVGAVFRMSEEKRPFLWIDVAENISKYIPNIHFVIVGTGPLEASVLSYVKSKNLNNIHLVGKQSNVADWYTLFDLLLMTSRVEGVSNVVIESQYCGTPVVVPDVGGLSEAVDDEITGYLLKDQSIEKFTRVVVKILSNEKLVKTLTNNAVKYANIKFSAKTMVDRYIAIYSCPLHKQHNKIKGQLEEESKLPYDAFV